MYAQGFGSAIMVAMAVTTCSMCVAIPGLVILNAWLVNKSLDTWLALVMLGGVVGVFGVMIKSWGHPLCFVLLVLLLLACALSPWLAARCDKAGLARLEQEDIRKYKLALEHDPRNAAARSYLARTYLKQGRYDEAIEEFNKALEIYPESPRDRHLLQRAIEEKQRQEAEGPVCKVCGAVNPPGAEVCAGCERPLREPGFLKWLLEPENLKSVTLSTAITCLGVAISSMLLSQLSTAVGFVVLLLSLCGGAGYLWHKVGN